MQFFEGLCKIEHGEEVDLTLRFGERPEGGVSIGVRLEIGREHGSGAPANENEENVS